MNPEPQNAPETDEEPGKFRFTLPRMDTVRAVAPTGVRLLIGVAAVLCLPAIAEAFPTVEEKITATDPARVYEWFTVFLTVLIVVGRACSLAVAITTEQDSLGTRIGGIILVMVAGLTVPGVLADAMGGINTHLEAFAAIVCYGIMLQLFYGILADAMRLIRLGWAIRDLGAPDRLVPTGRGNR